MLLRLVFAIAAMALLTTACGDDGGSDAEPDGATSAPDDNDSNNDNNDADANEPTDRSDELLGSWNIATFQIAGGLGEADAVGDEPVTIEFLDDGTLNYSTGCNTGSGEWEARGVYRPSEGDDDIFAGQGITFGGLSSTEIACDDERADQDLAIGGGIRAAETFTIEDGTLTLIRDGNVMLSATRG